MGIVMRRAHVVLVTFPRVIDSNFVWNSIQWGQMEFMAVYDLSIKILGCVTKGCKNLICFEQLWWQISPIKSLEEFYTNIIR